VEKNERRSLKYIRLAAFLADQPAEIECIRMSVPEIEEVVGERLPANARLPSWWRNDERKMHSRAWLTAGWKVSQVKGDAEVEFVRSQG
jgi:hypothetical protein